MAKPILKLHIGLHKTGTTYIQSSFVNRRQELIKEGILYPLAGLHGSGHATLAKSYLSEKLKAYLLKSNILSESQPALRMRDNILYERGLMKLDTGPTIVSAEALALVDHDGVNQIAEHYLPYFDIQVIVFLRRQDFLAESSRAQAYKINQVEFNQRAAFDPLNLNYNFIRIVDCWSNRFGDASVRVVEYPERQDSSALNNLISDLFGLPASFQFDKHRVNERLGRDVLEYIYGHSKLVYGTKPYFSAIKKLTQYSRQNQTAAQYRHFYSPQERMEILDIHKESNKLVSDKYKWDLFDSYPTIEIDEEWAPYPGLSEKQVEVFDKLVASGFQ